VSRPWFAKKRVKVARKLKMPLGAQLQIAPPIGKT
jgi:hypothetical protein